MAAPAVQRSRRVSWYASPAVVLLVDVLGVIAGAALTWWLKG